MFKILSTASALPKCRKTNDDLSTFLDTSDEWISQRTGIRERAVCTDETLTDLLTQAASQALERAGITAQELDLNFVCNHPRRLYHTVSGVCYPERNRCKLSGNGYQCSMYGFIYALDVAQDILQERK